VEYDDYVTSRGPALLRLGYLLTGDRQKAEDLVQDVLVKAHGRWRRISRLDQPDAYLRAILTNRYLSHRRLHSTHEVPTDDVDLPGSAPPRLDADPADTIVARDAAWRLLATLPRRQRAVLVLRFYEDFTDAAIAAVLGCSPSTVRSQAARALEALRVSPQLAAFTGPTNRDALRTCHD
jgi:RNA polymerase sigma-70 factor (sigma-E family)